MQIGWQCGFYSRAHRIFPTGHLLVYKAIFYQISIIRTIFSILSHFREIKLEIKSRETTETTPGINNVFSVSTGLGKKLKILEIK